MNRLPTRCLFLLLVNLCLVSSALLYGFESNAGTSTAIELRQRYQALKAEIAELRRRGEPLPARELRRLHQSVLQGRQERNLEKVEEALNEIDALLQPYRTAAIEPTNQRTTVSFDSAIGGNGKCGPKGEGMESHFGVGYATRGLAELFAGTGARWSKVPLVSWGRGEPSPPRNGKHYYKPELLDEFIQEYQKHGFHLHIVLKASNPWANDLARTRGGHVGPGKGAVSMLPKPEYLQDYYSWVAAIVERYDADGFEDMPGLRFPVLHWEIESEAQHEGYWRGTKEEYGELLKTAYHAAKSACPEARIILAGFNIGDLFVGEPDQREIERRVNALPPFHKKAIEFIKYSLSLVDHYDEIELHYNRDYRTLPHEVAWIQSQLNGRKKPIWAGDTISTVWLFQKGREKPLPYEDETIFNSLRSGETKNAAARWFRAEQARMSVKKIVTAAGEGLTGVILETMVDWPPPRGSSISDFYKNWMVSGIIGENKRPRPAYHALKQVATHLKGFTDCRRVDSGPGVYAYRFTFDGKPPVFVAWSESGESQLTIDIPYTRAGIEEVFTEAEQVARTVKENVPQGRLRLNTGPTPKFIYSLD